MYLSSLGGGGRLLVASAGSRAITARQQAINHTPDNHSNRGGRINKLGVSFFRRFECLNELSDPDVSTGRC